MLGVGYRRDLTYSIEELQPFFVNNDIGASVRRAREPVRRAVVGRPLQMQYQNLLTLPTGLPDRIDTTWNYAGSFGYRLGRQGRAGVGFSYYDRSSSGLNVLRSYNGLRFGSVVSFGL